MVMVEVTHVLTIKNKTKQKNFPILARLLKRTVEGGLELQILPVCTIIPVSKFFPYFEIRLQILEKMLKTLAFFFTICYFTDCVVFRSFYFSSESLKYSVLKI